MPSRAVTSFLERLDEKRAAEVEDDVGPLRSLTLEERGKVVESVCRDAMAIMRARPDFETAVRHRDPRSPGAIESWQRAVERFRKRGRDSSGSSP